MLTQAIKELEKRPKTNQAALFYLIEHQQRLDRLMASIEVVLSENKKGAVQPYYIMQLEKRWLELTQL